MLCIRYIDEHMHTYQGRPTYFVSPAYMVSPKDLCMYVYFVLACHMRRRMHACPEYHRTLTFENLSDNARGMYMLARRGVYSVCLFCTSMLAQRGVYSAATYVYNCYLRILIHPQTRVCTNTHACIRTLCLQMSYACMYACMYTCIHIHVYIHA